MDRPLKLNGWARPGDVGKSCNRSVRGKAIPGIPTCCTMHIHYSPPCSRLICAWVHCIHTYTPLSSHLHVTPPRRTESATCGRVVRQLRLKTPHLRATRRGTLAQRMLNEMGQVVWSQSRKHGRKRRRSGVAGTGHTAPAHTVCSIRPSSPPMVNRAAPLPSGELV